MRCFHCRLSPASKEIRETTRVVLKKVMTVDAGMVVLIVRYSFSSHLRWIHARYTRFGGFTGEELCGNGGVVAIWERGGNTQSGEDGADGENGGPVIRLEWLNRFSWLYGLEPCFQVFHPKGIGCGHAEKCGILLCVFHENDFSRSPWIEHKPRSLAFHSRNDAAERNESSGQKKSNSEETDKMDDEGKKGPSFPS